MNYEQMYKETRRWIESIYPELGHEKQMLAEKLFPELKESEDERIRKNIIKTVELYGPKTGDPKVYNDMISWLGKQGEKKPEENKGNIGEISPNWSKEDEVKDNWEYIQDFVKKLGHFPKDSDELDVLINYVLGKKQKFV